MLKLKTHPDGKKFANRPLQHADFSEYELCNADFRNAKLQETVFDGSDLTCADFSDANCWGASFRGAKCYKATFKKAILTGCDFDEADIRGITITLGCDTFENVKLPKKWLMCWLFFPLLMDIPEDVKLKLEDIIGPQTVKLLKEARLAI